MEMKLKINAKPLSDFLAMIDASGELPDHANMSLSGLIDIIVEDQAIWICPSSKFMAMFPGIGGGAANEPDHD
jgi:hypothetical protein